ncbi:acyl carrier protein [Streptomyces sp. NPDC058291]|jgi:acyl carrier protein|uniref:acyl carrier protein n=1 Tax=Streptomyces sp. NPDC058291 TaxID=3346427 RepID=UPI0036F176D5
MEYGLAPTESAVLDQVHTILCDLLLTDSIPVDYDLMAGGVLDSSMFLQLFVELEKRFDIPITGADVLEDNFRTLETIARFVRAKRGEV